MNSGVLSVEQAIRRGGRAGSLAVSVPLLLLAAAGWWWSQRMATSGHDSGMSGMPSMGATMSVASFALAWVAMMAAMMLPAVVPVVRLYGVAAARGRAAPTAFFVLGYLAIWTAMAAPAYLAWQALEQPLAEGRPWVARVAGATLLAAALWQFTPLKTACLRHCRSPLGFFMRYSGKIASPSGAARMGAAHGVFCLGCCWAIFAVLVALGVMNLAWMLALTALIVLEKNAPRGEGFARAGAVAFGLIGIALLLDTSILMQLT